VARLNVVFVLGSFWLDLIPDRRAVTRAVLEKKKELQTSRGWIPLIKYFRMDEPGVWKTGSQQGRKCGSKGGSLLLRSSAMKIRSIFKITRHNHR
jgi:hypothetical protein